MRILKQDLKKGFMHLKAETAEDLWLLSRVLTIGDSARGQTERKLKLGGEDERNQKVTRKKMTLTVRVEKAEYEHDALRISGPITDGPEEVARGEYHTLTITPDDDVKVTKQAWMEWQLKAIKESTRGTKENILVALFDREQALFARLTGKGAQVISTMKGQVEKKDQDDQAKGDFWQDVAKQLDEYDQRYRPRSIIAGSPAFWKDYLKKALSDEVQKKTIYATVSDVNEQALQEVLKRPELKNALEQDRNAQERKLLDELLAAIAKDQGAYGVDEVEFKAQEGNLKRLLVSDAFLMRKREENEYEKVEDIMKAAERGKADVTIVTNKEACKQLDGLGGVAGLTRW
ncbi:MAG: mRNA surveillance protein pelota [Candidatus Woesearchaeota archaeon]